MSRKILIVDDTVSVREHMEQLLLAAGYQVLLADSGEQAVVRAHGEAPDLILLNVNMPELEGFATTRRLKGSPVTKDIPVVFITGQNPKADEVWGRMLGVRSYLAMSSTREDILAQVVC
jgi:twitching motility two-component system response regulator PilH